MMHPHDASQVGDLVRGKSHISSPSTQVHLQPKLNLQNNATKRMKYAAHGPPKPIFLEVFMVNKLVFRWPKPSKTFIFHGFGGIRPNLLASSSSGVKRCTCTSRPSKTRWKNPSWKQVRGYRNEK